MRRTGDLRTTHLSWLSNLSHLCVCLNVCVVSFTSCLFFCLLSSETRTGIWFHLLLFIYLLLSNQLIRNQKIIIIDGNVFLKKPKFVCLSLDRLSESLWHHFPFNERHCLIVSAIKIHCVYTAPWCLHSPLHSSFKFHELIILRIKFPILRINIILQNYNKKKWLYDMLWDIFPTKKLGGGNLNFVKSQILQQS